MTGKVYSKDLGIKLSKGSEAELFKWLLACLLFGKPIQQAVAKMTYSEFVKDGLTSPDAILRAGWDKLVSVLDKGHYVRYDYSTATKLLEICEELKGKYGSIKTLIRSANNKAELKRKLEEFKGIGPVTARIFLRELKLIK